MRKTWIIANYYCLCYLIHFDYDVWSTDTVQWLGFCVLYVPVSILAWHVPNAYQRHISRVHIYADTIWTWARTGHISDPCPNSLTKGKKIWKKENASVHGCLPQMFQMPRDLFSSFRLSPTISSTLPLL